MTYRTLTALAAALLLGAGALPAQADALPMPPTFTPQTDMEQTLRAYPLGLITRQAAFSHHGKAHREVTLPNGLVGWVYDLGGPQKEVTYARPSGAKQTVPETGMRHGVRTYTLVFDQRGVVVDVLYNEDGRHDGLAALPLQHRKGVVRLEEHAHPAGGR